MKIFILAAKNGSGKGTFGKYLCAINKNCVHIDAGQIVRQEIKNQTHIGKLIQPIYENCKYLDDSIDKIIWDNLIKDKLEEYIKGNHTIIIDGCLRSKTSFHILNQHIKSKKLKNKVCVVKLEISDKECMNRILNRKICPICFFSYNNLLEEVKICKNCAVRLIKRKSDTKEFTLERLKHFHEIVEPIIQEAIKEYAHIEINTECDIKELKKKYDKIFKINYFQDNL